MDLAPDLVYARQCRHTLLMARAARPVSGDRRLKGRHQTLAGDIAQRWDRAVGSHEHGTRPASSRQVSRVRLTWVFCGMLYSSTGSRGGVPGRLR
jgi:hypothetical protein